MNSISEFDSKVSQQDFLKYRKLIEDDEQKLTKEQKQFVLDVDKATVDLWMQLHGFSEEEAKKHVEIRKQIFKERRHS